MDNQIELFEENKLESDSSELRDSSMSSLRKDIYNCILEMDESEIPKAEESHKIIESSEELSSPLISSASIFSSRKSDPNFRFLKRNSTPKPRDEDKDLFTIYE